MQEGCWRLSFGSEFGSSSAVRFCEPGFLCALLVGCF